MRAQTDSANTHILHAHTPSKTRFALPPDWKDPQLFFAADICLKHKHSFWKF